MAQDYNTTLNLPKTEFPMRAGLPKREPDMLKSWYDMDLYHEIIKRNEGKPQFILHDGPPFSNGNIHMGTAMNKCLKDFIVRYKNMTGFRAPYVPGWDNHGMPIESAIIKRSKLNRKQMSIPEFRSACKDFAQEYVDIQMASFKRLGVIGDWDNPYLTMNPEFEAEEVRVFGEMVKKGYIYKGKKPVYWCPFDETALAEAEIEYADDTCKSIFVKFPVSEDYGKFAPYCDLKNTYFVIWTTTTWTLPGNLAICLNARLDYVLAKAPNGETYVLAKELMESVAKAAGIEGFEILHQFKGEECELMRAKHPLYDRESVILLGDHVTLDAGTGCVHTAPGHGMEDYMACRAYDYAGKTSIGVLVPVDDRGYMTAEAGKYEGLYYEKANDAIFADLVETNALLAYETITHQYPHCWRCKKPIIYRATDQWFCSVDAFKDEAIAACADIKWMPDWGYGRMVNMLADRADWCISRQRRWGLPIPVFYCDDCGEILCDDVTIEAAAQLFAQKGSNAWFELDANDILPESYVCPKCGKRHFTKEIDTLDGWFDSGSTHIASLAKDNEAEWPSDLYLEGADQYRGWFQSSLLTAVAVRGKAPYKAVLTHGWVVDGEGKAMHKSLGNGVYPEEVIPKFGADLLRLWAASTDFRADVRCSDAMFKQLSDTYLKIRNTARYILGNIADFDPNTNAVAAGELEGLDKWAISRMNALINRCIAAYEEYEFHAVVHAIHNFCVVDMSNFYLDIIKDRLYCEAPDSQLRRSSQTAIWMILDAMVRLVSPILAFTSNEIWLSMPHAAADDARHVALNDMPKAVEGLNFDAEHEALWNDSLQLRGAVNKALELARAEKIVGKPLDAEVTLFVTDEVKFAPQTKQDLKSIFITSGVTVVNGDGEGFAFDLYPGVKVAVKASTAPKCLRCWAHDEKVGEDQEHPALCPRCARVVKSL